MRAMQRLGWKIHSDHGSPSHGMLAQGRARHGVWTWAPTPLIFDFRSSYGPSNNTKEARHQSMYNYLDSMTHVSHRCAGKAQYMEGAYAIFPDWAFPSTGTKTPLHMQLSHAMLAATGTVWSIDRTCDDFLPGGFCVGYIAGLPYPHCHTVCNQKWALGPGGVASWGISDFTHHLPSPGVALVQQTGIPEKQYNDKGCGDGQHVVV
jgi:hypothetical protein